jgi:hypothetical protein
MEQPNKSYRPHKKQAQAHLAFLTGGFKRGVLLFGRQTGKTFFSVNHAWLSAVIQQGRYFVVFKTYKQAKEVVWRQYVPLIPKELIFKTNDTDLLIEFNYVKGPVVLPDGTTIQVEHDETKPRSTLQLLGSDQADSHRGFRADGIVFDEYGDQDPENFKLVYEPMFSTTDGWAIFMGTPRGYNHFYDLIYGTSKTDIGAKADPKWFYLEATWKDSPFVKPDFIAERRHEAEKMGDLSGFLQEYELEFRSVTGAVYPDLNREFHQFKPGDEPEDLTYYGAIDFGWHTTAFLLIGIDKDQRWWIIDEVYGRQETLDSIIPRIQARLGDKRLSLVIADSADREAVELMRRKFPVVGINKALEAKNYSTGIGLVTEKLKAREQLVGKPKPSLRLSTACKNLIIEMESYHFEEKKEGRNISDVPVKENDHGPDALRYFALHMKYGMINKAQTIKAPLPNFLGEFNI